MTDRPVLPPRLKRGDTIGLFCPAGPVRDVEGLRLGIGLIEDLGFRVKLRGPVEPRDGYLADADERRAEHLHRLWSEPEVRAIVAIRGGYGCQRMVGLLDWELFRREPKWFVGFSDVTVLLNALPRAGRPGRGARTHGHQHGPHRAAQRGLALCPHDRRAGSAHPAQGTGGAARRQRSGPAGWRQPDHAWCTCWARPGMSPWDGCILVLEDTNEPLYRLDRMFTQLAQAGRLDQLAGLLLGDFDAGEGDRLADLRFQEAVWSRVMELVPAGLPVWAGFPSGHRQRNLALPIGMEASLEGGTLRLLPDSVRLA